MRLIDAHRRCVGCVDPDSEWSRKGAQVQHTVVDLNPRHRNGLEPSGRLSKTIRPRHLGAFRVAVTASEVHGATRRCELAHLAHRVVGRDQFVTGTHQCLRMVRTAVPRRARSPATSGIGAPVILRHARRCRTAHLLPRRQPCRRGDPGAD